MIPTELFALGVGSSMVANEVVPQQHSDSAVMLLENIRDLLHDLSYFLKLQQPEEQEDIYKIITLYKSGVGPPYMPENNGRQYCRIVVPVATVLSVIQSPLGPPFTYTLPPPTAPSLWLPLDFPDGSQYLLDTTATAPQMQAYIRYTNQVVK